MPYSATFTLTAGSSANVGPFSIVGNPGSVSLATGVTRTQLLAGRTYTNIADTVTSFTITSSGTCTNSITKQTNPATPTPTVTVTQAPQGDGYCYRYEVSDLTNQNNYGVRYTDPGVGSSQDVKFNMLPGLDGNGFTTFMICSSVDPTLLDYTIAPPNPTGVGSVSGVARFGGTTPCTSSLGCTAPPSVQYCYVDAQSVVQGPFSTMQECTQAAGGRVCDQCLAEPTP
jgi:hypothetical protein